MIKHALLSVSDKTGIVELGKALSERDVMLLSTGGTLRTLKEGGVKVSSVESYTGSPEVMGGRVKTLHPRIHGGLLARLPQDAEELIALRALPIDLVVVNLYPFGWAITREGATFADAIENIDIGGPCMLRAAAKNHDRVSVVCDPTDYAYLVSEMDKHDGAPTLSTRRRLAAKAFALTARYDSAIAEYLSQQLD